MEKRQGRKTTVRFSFPSSPHFSQRENLFNQLFIVRSKCHRFAFAFAFASPSPPESKPSQMQMLLHANSLLLAPTTSRLSASASASPGRSGTARPLPPPQGHAHSARAAARGHGGRPPSPQPRRGRRWRWGKSAPPPWLPRCAVAAAFFSLPLMSQSSLDSHAFRQITETPPPVGCGAHMSATWRAVSLLRFLSSPLGFFGYCKVVPLTP